jgi:hypothetical protein
MDMMVYRYVEKKSQKIGKVQKVLKSISVDCILNEEQLNFAKYMNQTIQLELSNGKTIPYVVQDKAYSSICDYSENCEYECHNTIEKEDQIDKSSYQYNHLHNDSLIKKVKILFTKSFLYKKQEIVDLLLSRNYQIENIDYALDYLVMNNEYLVDRYLRKGKIINIKDLYLFQPVELENEMASLYDQKRPVKLNKTHLKKFFHDTQTQKSQSDVEVSLASKKEISVKKTNVLNSLLQEINKKLSVSTKIDESNKIPYFSDFKKVSMILEENGIHVNNEVIKRVSCELIFNTLKLEDELLLLRYFMENESSLNEIETLLFQKISAYVSEKNGVKLYFTTDLYALGTETKQKKQSKQKEQTKSKTKIIPYVIENKGNGKQISINKASPIDMDTYGIQNVQSLLEVPSSVEKHKIMTFMDYYIKTKDIEVKTRDLMGNKKNKGALFANKSVKDRYPIINQIMKTNMIVKDEKTLKFGVTNIKLTDSEWVVMLLLISYYYSNEKVVYYLDKVLYNFNL